MKHTNSVKHFIQQNQAYLQVGTGAIMVSFSSVFVKLSTAGPSVEAVYRMLFGGIILFFIALYRREAIWVNKTTFFAAVLAGALFTGDLVFWHKSILLIGPGLATIIVNLQIFVLALVGIVIYKECANAKFYLALILAAIGLYLLIGYEWRGYTKTFQFGITLSFIALLFYTAYIFAIRRSQMLTEKYKPVMNLAIASLAAALVAAAIAWFQGEQFAVQGSMNWLWLLMYGFFGQVLGWLLISMGLPKIKLSISGFLLLLQPALAFIWGIVIFQEIPAFVEVLGAILTLFAIYLSSTANEK